MTVATASIPQIARNVAVVVGLILSASPAAAQDFFPRFDFRFDGQYMVSDDRRFNWAFDFGGDVDVVRAGKATATFVANYEAIAGEEFRRFDVNQGNYLLEGVLLFTVHGIEIGPVWHHVSRHLSDRPKRFPIDWNQISVRARDTAGRGDLAIAWQGDARVTVTNAYVDYDWELEGRTRLTYRLSPRMAAVGSGGIRVVGVEGTRLRGTQTGGRVEAGLRFEGTGASAELFIGAERRIDPYPLEFSTASWFLAGLRLLSR